ncbi:hypothetical protein LTS09_007402 [Friedmanniomyces endolithicus]|nr:hypothetical protein LTS09_007402 [Friedmanniomyces endolithicus]KAK0829318.1 hypothetical protein LTR73_004262 [Friedmanniomyces endolithicus]
MSGSNTWRPGYVPNTTDPEDPTKPRYLPPQKRETTFSTLPPMQRPIQRPESAMSTDSFISQSFGGVSLGPLLHKSDVEEEAERKRVNNVNTVGGMEPAHGYRGDYGRSVMMEEGRTMMGQAGGSQQRDQGAMGIGGGSQQREQGAMGIGGIGRPRAPTNFITNPVGFGGNGGVDTGPQGNKKYGNELLANSQALNIYKQSNVSALPAFGAIGNTVSRYGPGFPFMPYVAVLPQVTNDPARSRHNRRAVELANLIRLGLADPGDEDFDPPAGPRGAGRSQERSNHQQQPSNSMAPPGPPQFRATRSVPGAELDPAYKPAIAASRECNIKGNSAAYIAVETQPLPGFLASGMRGIKPTVEEFFLSMPVIEACRTAVATNAGVIRIRNIPFTTTRAEIIALVGRNAQIVSQPAGSPYYAVHIIMERHTGKTMDAFVEFARASEAHFVVAQFNKRLLTGRIPRLGDRLVEVELSDQEELMNEMFPRAKNVVWEGATPHVLVNKEMYYKDVVSAGFTGFLQNEEVVMVIKHAETPHRSPFAQRAIIRVYESWISTLHKYPWFAHECVLMIERRLLYDATMALSKTLIIFLRKTQSHPQVDIAKPTPVTLQELTVATLTCPGFSEMQKAAYIQQLTNGGYGQLADSRGMNLKFGGVGLLAPYWPFMAVVRDPAAHEDLVFYFARLMREATTASKPLSLVDRYRLRASGGNALGPFGSIRCEYGNAKTLVEVAGVELRMIEELLNRVLPRSRPGSA